MTVLRNLLADLVAKRLWPVAAGLVVALVAVPVVLKGGGAEETPPLPTAQTSAPKASQPLVSVADQTPRGGRGPIGRNPFAQRDVSVHAPATTPAAGTSATSAAAGAAAAGLQSIGAVPIGGSGSGGGTSSGTVAPSTTIGSGGSTGSTGSTGTGGSTGGSKTTTKTTTTDRDSWHVDLRFGQDGQLATRTDVARLSPLPSSGDPFFVFLGVMADGKTALFLVSSDAEATGDGKCLPSPTSCERVQLQAGETEFFDVTQPDGKTVQYQLDLVKVSRQESASAAVASAARARESAAGRAVLREAVKTDQVNVSDLAYSRDLGLVVPSGRAAVAPGSELFGGYRVDLRFGTPTPLIKRYNLARLTPLPSVDVPTLLYLGVMDDGRSALFLNPTGAAAAGDAVCDPTPQDCQRVSLKAGQQATFDAQTMDGGTQSYQLVVDAITPLDFRTADEARASRHRESPAGREVLRKLIGEVGTLVGDLTFAGGTGTVAHAAVTTPDPAAGAPQADG